jgi:hypothetical protein
MTAYQPRYPLARRSPVKAEILYFEVARQSVMDCDPSYLLNLLKDISSTRQQVLEHEGCIGLCFAGWDFDPRETAEIPEIRAYFKALTAEFPYWLHYVEKAGDTFFHVMRLLCDGHYIRKEPGMVAWSFDDLPQMHRTIRILFGHMNELHQRFAIPREINERISQEIAQLIECTLE